MSIIKIGSRNFKRIGSVMIIDGVFKGRQASRITPATSQRPESAGALFELQGFLVNVPEAFVVSGEWDEWA
jgi:hypothetical protein